MDNRPVFRFAQKRKLLIAVVCVALLALRVGGLHVHLCMDGSEPPLSVHVADSGVHHLDEAEEGDAHADRDVAIAADAVLKKSSGELDLTLLAALGALLLFVLMRPRPRLTFAPVPARATSARAHLRPPLRGPPRLA
ncbi:MAG TPA: hypothetical protein VFS58_03510 [Steroidobacteraceae bacterium]|nr:hypothetical protein [Steroidobacteraceae bacterium]